MSTRNVRYENGNMIFDSIISDDGIGMSEEFQKQMFAPFEQENTSRGAGQQGSGLGLSIVKKLVDLFGGTIDVESSPGQGTTFILHLTLPLAPDDSARQGPGRTRGRGSVPGPDFPGGGRQ
jgi:two-component system CheB/CheR fusion protein